MSKERISQGHCLCGAISVSVRGDLGALDFCHCSQCRRASGSAFASNAPVARARVALTATPADALHEYRATPEKARIFCRHCGSPIYSVRDSSPDTLRLRLGLFDMPLPTGRRAHIWAASKAPWYEITDSYSQYAAEAKDKSDSGT